MEEEGEKSKQVLTCAVVHKGVNKVGKMHVMSDHLVFRSGLLNDPPEVRIQYDDVEHLKRRGVGGISIELKEPEGEIWRFATFPRPEFAYRTLKSAMGFETLPDEEEAAEEPTGTRIEPQDTKAVPQTGTAKIENQQTEPVSDQEPVSVVPVPTQQWRNDLWKEDINKMQNPKIVSDMDAVMDSDADEDSDNLSTSSSGSNSPGVKTPDAVQRAQISPNALIIVLSIFVLVLVVIMVIEALDANEFATNELYILKRSAWDYDTSHPL
ncbi:hypothetical protein NDN08_004149 [Rhodosorus marinus]|uniref:GRAM domain-containing protein n=1 Tax=Rhodosorus marinus TaxID=101924 RepID=A0AAV8UL24_9RHOD|nr:hypothetical protein NDN08_004149 [Rhodosorus marinus]